MNNNQKLMVVAIDLNSHEAGKLPSVGIINIYTFSEFTTGRVGGRFVFRIVPT